jgi:hypothetical protein
LTNRDKEDPHNVGPGPTPEDHHQEDRMTYMHKLKDKTDFGDILMPDDRDQPNPKRMITTAGSTHLQDRQHELTHHVAEYDAMHMDTKYETNFEKAMQQTAPMNESVDTNTDNAVMLADSTHQQGMNEAYSKKAAMSRTTTNDAQCHLINEHSIPRAFFINKAVARRPLVPDAASKKKKKKPNVQETLCQEDIGDETCLHIIDMPETPDDAGTHADNTYEEEAVDKTCPEKGKYDMPRTTAHNIFNTKSHQNNSWQTSPRQEFAAPATLANYDEEFAAAATLATYDEEFAAATLATTLATYKEEFAAATTLERGSPREHN